MTETYIYTSPSAIQVKFRRKTSCCLVACVYPLVVYSIVVILYVLHFIVILYQPCVVILMVSMIVKSPFEEIFAVT